MKKPIPAGKKGKGIRKLKKVAPQVAKRMGYKKGGKASSAYHTTKDGRRVKKGLYYYMNKAKKSGKINR